MGEEFVDQTEETLHVRHFRVCVERLLVNPFRVNKEDRGIARRLVEMDANAAGLGGGKIALPVEDTRRRGCAAESDSGLLRRGG
jgi:hypothetical protein